MTDTAQAMRLEWQAHNAQQIAARYELLTPAAIDLIGEISAAMLPAEHAGRGAVLAELATIHGLRCMSATLAGQEPPPWPKHLAPWNPAQPKDADNGAR